MNIGVDKTENGTFCCFPYENVRYELRFALQIGKMRMTKEKRKIIPPMKMIDKCE
jgi:hypothetical protein